MSKVEQNILNKEFKYFEPYFYNHELSCRCELGIGGGRKYIINAYKRAVKIYNILFANGMDAFFYESKFYDYDYNTEDVFEYWTKQASLRLIKETNFIADNVKAETKENLRYQQKYYHKVVRNVPFYSTEEIDSDAIQSNRIVCYPKNNFNAAKEIKQRMSYPSRRILHFVSFANECIMSIYDDRGCDVVFFEPSKFVEFYDLLKPYFLQYDCELMAKKKDDAIKQTAQ